MKRLMIVVAAVLVSLPVFAQKSMYRCGNNYQDRPCDGGSPGAAKPAAAGTATPAAKSGAAATAAATTVADAPKAPVVLTKAQQQRQIRCENFGRQREELRDRQKAAPQQADAIGVQIKSLESRMSADSCS